jgi:hypothetical protein
MNAAANAYSERIFIFLHVERRRPIAKIDCGKAIFVDVKSSNCTAGDE